MTYDIIATGSDGNATVLGGEILVDCGVPYKSLEKHVKGLKLVLLTHEHGDHFNAATVRRLVRERPALRWGCCEWMIQKLVEAGANPRQIDCYAPWFRYSYPDFAVTPVPLPHNVPNCGYRIEAADGYRVFYATDCGSLDAVTAQNYDLYLVEANHTRAELEARAAEKEADGRFAYERRAAENHLSREQAVDWLTENMGPKSVWVPMHGHKSKNEKGETTDE